MQKRIREYLRNKVEVDPRAYGTAMQGSNVIKLWRYRVGDYSLICQIKDSELIVLLVKLGKRDFTYKDRA